MFFFRRLLKSVACSGEDFFYAVYRFATELGRTPQQLVLSLVEGVGIIDPFFRLVGTAIIPVQIFLIIVTDLRQFHVTLPVGTFYGEQITETGAVQDERFLLEYHPFFETSDQRTGRGILHSHFGTFHLLFPFHYLIEVGFHHVVYLLFVFAFHGKGLLEQHLSVHFRYGTDQIFTVVSFGFCANQHRYA